MSERTDNSNGARAPDVELLLAEYVERLNAGEAIRIETIEAHHPEVAEELIQQLRLLQELHQHDPSSTELGTLGDYTLRRQIGRGGMGVVYDAWQNSIDRRVALKVLPAGIAADDRSFSRFMREARAAGKLSHPNVVSVHSMGQEENTPYYTMEYVEGETLGQMLADFTPEEGKEDERQKVVQSIMRRFIKNDLARAANNVDSEHFKHCTTERPLRDSQVAYPLHLAEAMAGVADGLQHAHSNGVIHRDIKPSNLILDGNGHLRILDFGLARLEGQGTITMSGDFVGTPLYVSPEQARRRKIPIDHRTDIYSLGATMYEMLAWYPPFRGDDARDTLTRIIESDPEPLRKPDTTVPREVETIVLKCLRKEPSDRYGSAEDLAKDLRRFVRGEPIEARPQPAWKKLSRRLWRSRTRISACAMMLAFLSVVGYLLLRPQVSATRLVWRAPSQDRRVASFMGDVSHDGRYLTYADWDTGNLAVRDLVEDKSRAVTKEGTWIPPVGYAEGSVWSPDAQQIAYYWYDEQEDMHRLRTIQVGHPTPRILCRNREYIRPGDWSSDGKSIFSVIMRADRTPEIVQVSVADGSRRVLKTVNGRWPGPLRLSPDDRYVAYSLPPDQHTSEHDVFLLATDGVKEKHVVQHPADDNLLGWMPDGKRILFTSDRRGSVDLWSLEVEQGEAKGTAQLVKTGIGTCEPFGFTEEAAFYYGTMTGMNDVYIGSLNPETGTFEAAPKKVTEFFQGKNQRPDWSFDGKHLGYISERSPGGGFDCIVRSLETGKERPFRLSVGFNRVNIRVSPDASSVLVRGTHIPNDKRAILKLDTQTGVLTPFLVDTANSRLAGYSATTSWSPDGKSVFYVRWENNEIARVIERSVETGEENEIYRTNGRIITSVIPSHDGARLTFSTRESSEDASRPTTYSINVISRTGGGLRELIVQHDAPIWPIAWTPNGEHVLYVEREPPPDDQLKTLWRISARGGQPKKMGVDKSRMRSLRLHPDGRQLTFVMGKTLREVWVMEKFQLEDG